MDMQGASGDCESAYMQARIGQKQMLNFIRESDIVKNAQKAQRSSFRLNPIAAAITMAMASQFPANVAQAGSGFGNGINMSSSPVTVQTYYANSPSGAAPAFDPLTGLPVINGTTGLPNPVNTGTALRKFVDTLPGIGAAKVNNLGQYIPVAVPEKWVDLNGVTTADDYYEIAAVEYSEKMHSDLPKATHLRGYVQLMTPGLAAKGVVGIPFTTLDGQVLSVVDNPHHLGPIINSVKGTAVRVKFTNLLPVGGKLFLPVDTTITGAGGPYTQNRAGMHLVGGQAPWVSAGSPHQWVAPAGEVAAYAAGVGKGASAKNVPDMADPGNGSTNLYFPNDMTARFMFIQDRTSGLTRLNSYSGLESGYFVTDPAEQTLITGGTVSGGALNTPVTVAAGTIPADQIPLIIEDKTFVPANIAQQDAKWDTVNWGQPGDLWFPHVYEPNQDPGMVNGLNPVGRWDYGPLFWPIFPVVAAKATLPTPSFTPEAYMDTPVINGTAYPTLTVDPKAYRFRILNASNDRYINLGLYKADPLAVAPQLDMNGNPVVNASGVQQFFTNTEVKMVPAAAINAAGNPPGWDTVKNVQLPLPQFPVFPWNINAEPSGPTRAWPTDGRAGGAPDPTTSGPDFVVIGNDGGLLPNAVDIPPQPVTYEQNRRSITVTNIYGYGMLLGPAERADAIVDFTAYAGQTLILYNDAPAPTPFNDPRNDYYTGDPDLTGTGGAYSTLPGYGPNTRTMMQIKVNATNTSGTGGPLNATALSTALPAAYGASQPAPLVPEVAYNAAFGTSDADVYAHVATGSAAQPTLDFTRTGLLNLIPGPMNLITSGGPGTGSGSGYLSAPNVVISGGGGTGATATATVNPTTKQVSSVTLTSAGSGYTSTPTVTFIPTSTVSGIVVADGGAGYSAGTTVNITGGGGTGAQGSVTLSTGSPILSTPTVTAVGSGYVSNPTVSITGGGGSGATATAAIVTSAIASTVGVNNGGSGYTAPTVTVSPSQTGGTQATVTPIMGWAISPSIAFVNGSPLDPLTASVSFNGGGGSGATASVSVDPISGLITAITLLTAGSGYTSAPTLTISDINGLGTATATATLAPGTGTVAGMTVTNQGTGYSAAPTITFKDVTGTGAVATATLANPVGILPGNTGTLASVAITNAGKGYTSAPTITISDINNNTSAKATVALAMSAGTITGITVTNPGSGYTSAPVISFTDPAATGTGASATASIAAAGVGAQATVVTSTLTSIPTITKAEQELFDDYGRYNSTGGLELPLTVAGIQTTVPLNYIDAPTEIIGDDEVQIWKLVDNGFWSNSIHFDMVDVQLINRVGWDGTVKPPASNEVGWKDTIRLNPLEDAIVAMRAKPPTIPFSLPRSARAQDPSVALGAPGSGMGFTVDPAVISPAGLKAPAGVALLSTAVNTNVLLGSVTGNYDSEFTWGSAILGHSEDDFTRPVVFNPVVTTPAAPTALADTLGTGVLSWTDPTPASTPLTTLANPQNELGFNILQAPVTNGVVSGPFAQFATVPANVTSWKEPVPLVSPVAYEVVAYNVAGTSAPSNVFMDGIPAAPTGPVTPAVLGLTPGFITPATTTADVNVTLNWQDNANNETSYIVTKTGPGLNGPVVTNTLPPNLVPPSTNTTWLDNGPLVEGSVYKYDVVAHNAFGNSTPVLSGTMTAPVSVPQAPVPLTAVLTPAAGKPADVTLTWTDKAFNETSYTIARSGGLGGFATVTLTGAALTAAIVPNATGSTLTYVDTTVPENNTDVYTYTVCAVNSAGAGCTPASITSPITIPLIPTGLTAIASTALDKNGLYVDTVALQWKDNAFNETSYNVLRNGIVIKQLPANPNPVGGVMTFTDIGLQDALTYKYTVAAVNSAGAGTSTPPVPVTMPGIVIAAPTSVVATPNRAGSFIRMNWVNNATNATNVLVEESVNGGAWVNMGPILAATATTTQRTAAVAGNTYNFRVSAINLPLKSDSPYTYVASTLTSPTPPVAPTVAAPVINVLNGNVTLTWGAIAPAAGTTMSYRVNINANGVLSTVPTNQTTYTFRPTAAQIAAGSSFSFTVQAVETAIVAPGATYFGSTVGPASAPVTATLLPAAVPATPSALTATVASATRATLTWMDNATNETSYLVTTTNTTTGVVTTATVTRTAAQSTATGTVTYNATIVAGNQYSFTVVAQNTKYGATVSSAAAGPVTINATIPAAPNGVTATPGATGSRAITVTWTDNSGNESGFTVQRATVTAGVVGAFANAGTVGANVTTFTNTGLTAGRSYQYQVRANSLAGNSAFVTSATVVAR
jgi:hypothetical protein